MPDSYDAEAERIVQGSDRSCRAILTPIIASALRKQGEEIERLDKHLQSLTPMGSEFVKNPDRCVQYVKQKFSSNWDYIKKQKAKLTQQAEVIEDQQVEITKLLEAISVLVEALKKYGKHNFDGCGKFDHQDEVCVCGLLDATHHRNIK